MTALLLLATLSSAANATDSARVQWHLWSWTGAEAEPSYTAESELRAEQQLALDLSSPTGWHLDAIGALRDPAEAGAPLTGDLYRASIHYRSQLYSFDLGRLVLLGSRGLERLDGLSLQLGSTDALVLGAWGGRLWQPETWEVGDTWVAGAELRTSPSVRTTAGLGYEARLADDTVEHRLHAFGSLRDLRGSRASLLAEIAPWQDSLGLGLPPGRAELSGTTPAGRVVDVGASARWEGLTPATVPQAFLDPMDWLAGPGYAALDLDLGVQLGDLRLSGSASPTWRTAASGDPTLDGASNTGGAGAMGRASAGWQAIEPLWVGVSAVGARAEPSWVMGGVAEARAEAGPLDLEAEAGWFRFRPETGPMAGVFEGRAGAGAALPTPRSGALQSLTLLGEVAGGADRLLDPWFRGGLVLRGELGNHRAALP